MKIGTSILSNKIYCGQTRKQKDGLEIWIKKEDITEQAVKAVFEYMYNKAEETGVYNVSIEGYGIMQFERYNAKEAKQ
jgi:nucleoid DNA-binding protein